MSSAIAPGMALPPASLQSWQSLPTLAPHRQIKWDSSGSNPFKLTISRRGIAHLIPTSPESVSRPIGDFKERGIIKGTGQTIEILDDNKLVDICKCESLPAYKI